LRTVEKGIFCIECDHHVFEDLGTTRHPDFASELKFAIKCPFKFCRWFPGELYPPCHLTKEMMKPKLTKLDSFL
jgi:hypothetical protein